MTRMSSLTPEEEFLEQVKESRNGRAVQKAKLIALRADLPDALILAFEGDDDKIVYGQWIRRLVPTLRYEPLPCSGKKAVRDLKNAVARDLAGLNRGIFFFVDRDFDDLNGFEDHTNVFMTDTYSVENVIVTEEVLSGILRDEFPCHANPELRESILNIFRIDYAKFLEITSAINFRIYIARKVRIELSVRIPTSLRHLATVQLGNVQAVEASPEELVIYEREPTPDELAGLDGDFSLLDPKLRFRGKFALKFFQEWLRKIADECATAELGTFKNIMPGSVRRAEFVLSNFASKSQVPESFSEFLQSIVSSK